MSKIFAIHAYENIYCGLHGIEHYMVDYFKSEEEAREFAIEESISVMESYGVIHELEKAANEEYEPYSNDWDLYVQDCIDDNVGYQIWEVTKNIDSIEVLNEEFYNNPLKFIDEHCEKEIE